MKFGFMINDTSHVQKNTFFLMHATRQLLKILGSLRSQQMLTCMLFSILFFTDMSFEMNKNDIIF
jgi:hypothetical protein